MQRRGLTVVEARPFNAETPMAALGGVPTPTEHFYVRNHFDRPAVDPSTWRLRLRGTGPRSLDLSLEDLRSWGSRTLAVTLECAGNGRALATPQPPGTPWRLGAVSTATFAGVPLARVLDRVGVSSDVVEVVFTGADCGQVEPGRSEPFARSLPLAAAQHPDVLLAWAMNGAPLTPEHGAPLRLIVPGWYGMASVKWLVGIEAIAVPYRGYFQRDRYVYLDEEGTPQEDPVRHMRVRAVIASPPDGEVLPLRPIEVAGTAWSGSGPVTRVEVSIDGEETWRDADLGVPLSAHTARPWRLAWAPAGRGEYAVLARATDAAGHTQPARPVWNALGYGNNVIQTVRVVVD